MSGGRDRPSERLARLGATALSDAELLSLVLRTGRAGESASVLAARVLERNGGLRGLTVASFPALLAEPGLGPVKAATLAVLGELAARVTGTPLRLGRAIQGPADVHRHFSPRLVRMRRESFFVLLLDGRHRLIEEREVSRGTLTASLVHPREVFREAIQSAAAALVLVHNHPSGDPTPSGEDRSVTQRLLEAGRVIGIEVIDHVIVAEGGFHSLREAGDLSASPRFSG
jgi:DNA repair protein RadC